MAAATHLEPKYVRRGYERWPHDFMDNLSALAGALHHKEGVLSDRHEIKVVRDLPSGVSLVPHECVLCTVSGDVWGFMSNNPHRDSVIRVHAQYHDEAFEITGKNRRHFSQGEAPVVIQAQWGEVCESYPGVVLYDSTQPMENASPHLSVRTVDYMARAVSKAFDSRHDEIMALPNRPKALPLRPLRLA